MSDVVPNDELVGSLFEVKDTYVLPGNEREYKVAYAVGSKRAFTQLLSRLEGSGFTATLVRSGEEHVLTLRAAQPAPKKRSMLSVALLFFSVVSIIIFSVLEKDWYESISLRSAPLSGLTAIATYGIAVLTIVAAHDLAQGVAARRLHEGRLSTYMIPGIPNLTPLLPAYGPAVTQRVPAANRDRLFELVAWGPTVVFAISIVFDIVGEYMSVPALIQLEPGQCITSPVSWCAGSPSLVQYGVHWLVSVAGGGSLPLYATLSPLMDAASVGFLIAALSLLPISAFSGGVMWQAAVGPKLSGLMTYLSVILLVVFETAYLWAVGVVCLLLLLGRKASLQVLDEASEISPRKKWFMILGFIVASACIPVPIVGGAFALP